MLVLPHTHWDREWYHLAGRFRQRIVALVDELLDDPSVTDALVDDAFVNTSSGAPFLLDGQSVVLDDYLAVRPDRHAALAASLRAGRIEAGPWFVLADGLIPGGESLVRNLFAGRRTLARLGAAPPPVLYAPDAFGHPAAHPLIAAGFGFAVAVVWRGYGGPRWPDGDAVWWDGPDGSRVLLYHLPRAGYEIGSRLPPALPAARERWADLVKALVPRARLGFVLVPNGADHHARQERWAEAIDALTRAAAPSRVEVVSISTFVARALRAARTADLPAVAGELRDSYGYAWALQGTFATRTAQKRRAAHVERSLVRDVEPWVAFAAFGAAPVSSAANTRRALLDAAWRELLLCHPHDTLCGCSTDAVARALDARFDEVESQATGLRRDALDAITEHDVVRARGLRTLWRPQLIVRNRAARPRSGVAEVAIDTFVRDVAVGPESAGAWRPVRVPGVPVGLTSPADRVPLLVQQLLGRTLVHDRTESPRHYPDDDLVERATALVWVPTVPGLGVRAFEIAQRDPPPSRDAVSLPVVEGRSHAAVARAGDREIANGLLRVRVDAHGRVVLEDRTHGVVLDDLLGFEDIGDAGDLYTHSPVGQSLTTARCAGVRTIDRGPLRATLEVRYTLRVPESLAVDPDDAFSRPTRRSGRAVDLPITVRLMLDADAPFLRVRLTGSNRARDHRLRVVFRTGLAGDGADNHVVADAAFGPVVRRPLDVPTAVAAVERPPATAPLHRYVSRSGGEHGVTLFSDGLAEYEATQDGAVIVTLVRAVGELSRPDLPERPGHAGWPAATPAAQCMGPLAAEFALAVHGPDSGAVREQVEHLADDVLLPLIGETQRAALHVLSRSPSIELSGTGLTFSAAKPAERADGWVALRALNVTDRRQRGAWRIVTTQSPGVRDAVQTRLDESQDGTLAVTHEGDAAVVAFDAPPRAAITILVR